MQHAIFDPDQRRITWKQLERDPQRVVALIARLPAA